MAVTPRWGGLRIEPYKPNPKDADLDQIVQEGTVWERPRGTFIADELGNLLQEGSPGRTMEDRRGQVIVDRNGNRVDYKPSWAGQRLSTGERFRTVGASNGTLADSSRTIGQTRGTINTPPELDEEKLSFLRELSDDDLDKYIDSMYANRKLSESFNESESEWVLAALAVKRERQGDKTPEQVNVEERTPNDWGETAETVVKNTKVDNDLGPILSGDEIEEAVDGYSWQKERKLRLMLARERAKKVFNLIWRKDGDISKAPWEVPDPEDENGELIGETFEDAGQKFIALSRQQKEEYIKKMFMDGKEVDLGTKTVRGEEYRVTAEHIVDLDRTRFPSDEFAEQQRRFEEGQGPPPSPERAEDNTITVRGRWQFRLYDKDGNLVYDSEEGPNPTSTGDYANGGTSRELRVLEGQMLMENLGTDHTARFMRDGREVEVELRSLDESLADIFNTNTFTFANEIGIEKARLVASDKGVVVWAHKGYTPSKTSATTTQSLVTAGKLVRAWEKVDELRKAKKLDPNNPEHAELIIASAVLGDRERYLRVKGMLSNIDVDKLPQSSADIYSADEKVVDDALKEAGTSFDKAPKGDDILHAMLPSSGKLRDNVLAFNMWSLGENKSKGLDGRQRSEAIKQTPEVPELADAMMTHDRNNDNMLGLPTWSIVDPNAEVLINDGEQNLKPFKAPDDIKLVPTITASRTRSDLAVGGSSKINRPEIREAFVAEMDDWIWNSRSESIPPEGSVSWGNHDEKREELVVTLLSFLGNQADLPLGDPDASEKIKDEFIQAVNQSLIYRSKRDGRGGYDGYEVDPRWDGGFWSVRDGRLVFLEIVPKRRFGKRSEQGTHTVKELEEMGFTEVRQLVTMATKDPDLHAQKRSESEIDDTLISIIDYEDPFKYGIHRRTVWNEKQETLQQSLDDNPVVVNGFSGGVWFYANETPEAIAYKDIMEESVPLISKILNSNNGNSAEERIVVSFVPTDLYMDTNEAENISDSDRSFGGYFTVREIGTGTEPVKRIHISLNTSIYGQLQEISDPNISEERREQLKGNIRHYAATLLTHEYIHSLDASMTKIGKTYRSSDTMKTLLLGGGYLDIDESGYFVSTAKGRKAGVDNASVINSKGDVFINLFTDEDIEKSFPLKPDGTREDMAGYHLARMFKQIYEGDTVKELVKHAGKRESGTYYNTPVEVLARISEDAILMQVYADNNLLEFHPEKEVALFEKIRSDIKDAHPRSGRHDKIFEEFLDYLYNWKEYKNNGGFKEEPSDEITEYAERYWSFTRARDERLSRVSPELRSMFEGSNQVVWRKFGDSKFSYPVKNSRHYPTHFTAEEIAEVSEDFYGWLKGIGALEKDFEPVKINPAEFATFKSSQEYRSIEAGEDLMDVADATTGIVASSALLVPSEGPSGPKPPPAPAAVTKRRGVLSRLMEPVQPSRRVDLERFESNIVTTESTMGIVEAKVIDGALDTIASSQKSDAFVKGGKKVQIWGWGSGDASPNWAGGRILTPNVRGAYYRMSNRLGLVNPKKKSGERLSPLEKAEQVDAIVHELGHAYDYGASVGEGSKPVSASRKIFRELFENNPVFNKFMKKHAPESFGDQVGPRMINRRREKFKSEVGSIKISKDRVRAIVENKFPKRLQGARDSLEKKGIKDPTDEQIFDEFLELSGLVWGDVSSEITVEYLDSKFAFADAVLISKMEEDRVLQTLSKMSDDEFQELLEDMPYAMQARLTFFRSIATSSKYKRLRSVSQSSNFIEGLLDNDEETIDRLIILSLISGLIGNEANGTKRTFDLLDLASTFTNKDKTQMQYLRDPAELWAFAYAQSMSLEKISQLAGGDEEAKALIKELILLRNGDESVTDDVKRVLEGVKAANPELYRLADEYVEVRALDTDEILIRNLSDVDDVDDAFKVKNDLLGVIADDGMSSNPNTVKPKRASVQIDPKKRNDIVSKFQSVMGDNELSVDEAIKLIPDGKLDVYIDAHENSEDVVDVNGTVISRTEIDEDVYRRIQNRRLAIAAKMKQEKKRRNLDKSSYRSSVLTDEFTTSGDAPAPDFMDMDDFMDISSEELDLMEPEEIRELAEDLEIENIPKTTPLIKRRIMSTMAERFDESERQRAEKKEDELSRAKKFSKIYNKLVAPFVEKTAERFITRRRAAKGIRSNDPIELQEALEQGDEGVEKMLRNLDKFTPFAEALGKTLHTGKLRAKIASLSRPFRVGKAPSENVGERLRNSSEIRIQEVQKLIKNEGAKNTARKLLETAPDDFKKWLLNNYATIFNDDDIDDINESDLNNLAEKFVSQLHSAWASDSQIISAQLAAAEMAGLSREEIIEKVFWMPFYKENRKLNPKEKEAVLNVLLDAYDDDKRIAILYQDSLEGAGRVTSWGIEGRPLDDWDTIVSLAAGATYEDLDKTGGTDEDDIQALLGITAEEIFESDAKFDYSPQESELAKAAMDGRYHPEDSYLQWDSPTVGINKQSIQAIKNVLEIESGTIQQVLKDAGIEKVTLYRGIKTNTPNTPSRVKYAPLASFALEAETAMDFADSDGFIVEVAVPVEAIVSGFPQGFGSFPENEFIVDTTKFDNAPTAIRDAEEIIDKFLKENKQIVANEGGFYTYHRDDPANPYSAFTKSPAIYTDEYVEETLKDIIGQETGLDMDDATDEEIDEALKAQAEKIKEDLPDIEKDMNQPPGMQGEGWATVEQISDVSVRQTTLDKTSVLEYDDTDINEPPLNTMADSDIPDVDDEITYERSDEDVTVTIAEPIESIAEFHKEKKDWSQVTSDYDKRSEVAQEYGREPDLPREEVSGEVTEAWTALADEVEEQWELATKAVEDGGLGITIEFVDEDPYGSFAEMRKDFIENKRIKVLKTEATGGHPFFTNEQNDKFRAIHDIFGHLGTGRGFDRHGEEAAYQAHSSMFTETAQKAVATELRGQNSYLLRYGDFPPQKLFILPEDLRKSLSAWLEILTKVTKPWSFLISSDKNAIRDSDSDNLYDISRSHHISCGRYLA